MQLDNPSPDLAAVVVGRRHVLQEALLLEDNSVRDELVERTDRPQQHHGGEPQEENSGYQLTTTTTSSVEKRPDFSVDESDVYDLIRTLTDPEHPYSLEQLAVVSPEAVKTDDTGCIKVLFTPTIPHCSQATLIGLMIRVKLSRCLPDRLKTDVQISPGTHNTEDAVNRQLNDKERVAAALENPALLALIDQGISESEEDRAWQSILDFF
eukprot:GHVS01045963.1.p1 GENE.GHVS01045963.1~~GHVS01045963.1.p1  ORF type:complete len:210 (+),score=43.95 GHVS01045963.1:99-728(+)